jgi:hypothetical protein
VSQAHARCRRSDETDGHHVPDLTSSSDRVRSGEACGTSGLTSLGVALGTLADTLLTIDPTAFGIRLQAILAFAMAGFEMVTK